jgi:uncharacterized protein YaeQ
MLDTEKMTKGAERKLRKCAFRELCQDADLWITDAMKTQELKYKMLT